MEIRYQKNIDEIFTQELQQTLLYKNIAVIGCGAIGGYILEYLARLGVKSITFWDGDKYEESNLNRQIGCTEKTLGQNKAEILVLKMRDINSSVKYYVHNWYFCDKETDLNELLNSDFIFMGADSSYKIKEVRLLMRQALIKGIPIIDCPVQLLGGYVFINTNKDIGHFDYWTNNMIQQNNKTYLPCSATAYKCALIAAEAVNQMVLYFSNSRYACIDTELAIDIYHHKYTQSDKYCIF